MDIIGDNNNNNASDNDDNVDDNARDSSTVIGNDDLESSYGSTDARADAQHILSVVDELVMEVNGGLGTFIQECSTTNAAQDILASFNLSTDTDRERASYIELLSSYQQLFGENQT